MMAGPGAALCVQTAIPLRSASILHVAGNLMNSSRDKLPVLLPVFFLVNEFNLIPFS